MQLHKRKFEFNFFNGFSLSVDLSQCVCVCACVCMHHIMGFVAAFKSIALHFILCSTFVIDLLVLVRNYN